MTRHKAVYSLVVGLIGGCFLGSQVLNEPLSFRWASSEEKFAVDGAGADLGRDNDRFTSLSELQPVERATLEDIAEFRSEFDRTLSLYQLIANDDRQTLLERLRSVPERISGEDQVVAGSVMLGRLAELDPVTGLEFVLGNPGFAQQRWTRALFYAWARVDPLSSRSAAEDLPEPLRTAAGSALLQAQEGLSLQARVDLAETFRLDDHPLTTGSFPDSWAETQQIETYHWRTREQERVISSWARVDPASAWAAVQRLSDSRHRTYLQSRVLQEWSRRFPTAVLDLVLSDETISFRSAHIKDAIDVLAKRDLSAALIALDGVPEAQQHGARTALVYPLATADPDRLLQWVIESDDSEFDFSSYLALFQSSATEQGFDFSWIDELPPEKAAQAEAVVMSDLVHIDSGAALARVKQLPEGQRRWAATRAVAQGLVGLDTSKAIQLIETLPSHQQAEVYGSTFSQLARIDYAEAERYLSKLRDPAAHAVAAQRMSSWAPDAQSIHKLLQGIAPGPARDSALISSFSSLREMDSDIAGLYRAEYQRAMEAAIAMNELRALRAQQGE